jgi:hypothetical protein
MKWSRPDPKDEMIALLRQELEERKLENKDLRDQLLAVTAPGAYRRLHPDAPGQVVDLETSAAGPPSPGRIPPFKLQDEKMWEAVAERFERASNS